MDNDRRILAWLAILLSLFCCAPVACGTGFVALAGFITYVDAGSTWSRSDSILFGAFFAAGAVAILAGFLLAAWGLTALLKRDSNFDQEILDVSQAIRS